MKQFPPGSAPLRLLCLLSSGGKQNILVQLLLLLKTKQNLIPKSRRKGRKNAKNITMYEQSTKYMNI